METRKAKTLAVLAVAAAAVLFVVATREYDKRKGDPLVFSEKEMLGALWNSYKKDYLEPGTWRTLDKQRENITTSEGQSYTMLRAVWMDDKEAFDESWRWTRDNLKRPDDRLFAWLFGKRPDGTYGIMPGGGENTASDADVDIALALAFAYARWQDQAYLDSARGIIADVWAKEVVVIKGKPYLAANNLEKFSEAQAVLVNPSYFAPYAYKIFAKLDPDNDWSGLAATSYEVLEASMASKLDKAGSAGLPPDWASVDRRTGELSAATGSASHTSNYSYDALRVPFRVALDYVWSKDPRAKRALSKMSFLEREWVEKRRLAASYAHDGTVVDDFESPAMYGGSLGYYMLNDERAAREIYQAKLVSHYNPDSQAWKQDIGYYNSNIVWFALALYKGQLPDLSERMFR